MTAKQELSKETIRFYKEDIDLIRQIYPGGYGVPGINEVIREVLHSWVDTVLKPQMETSNEPIELNGPILD